MDRYLKKRLNRIEEKIQDKNPSVNLVMSDGTRESVLLDDLINLVIPHEKWKNKNMKRPLAMVKQAIQVENTPFNQLLVQKAKEIKNYIAHCAAVAEMQKLE